jgi:hypothetical protein
LRLEVAANLRPAHRADQTLKNGSPSLPH